VIYAGGVMSDSIIREKLTNKYDAYFAAPEFSCDNACGTAVYAYLKSGEKI
jgi:N6-L-threonylcarbamoyladenine synthase